MRITDRPPGTSIWNKSQGWTCKSFPALKESEVALAVHVNSGMPQYQLEEKLESAGFKAFYYCLGKNEASSAGKTTLLYLIENCFDYTSLTSALQKLETAGIPLSAVAIITPKLQQAMMT
jgi:hypothetical protein